MSIGERRKAKPDGQPGYVRVDMVHQGDQDGVTGVYHLNMVDEVTPWQLAGALEPIGEAWLKPARAAAWQQFPFQLKGFHCDNGSEFIKLPSGGAVGETFDRTNEIAAPSLPR